MADKTTRVRSLASQLSKPILKQCEWAGIEEKLHHDTPDRRGEVDAYDRRPAKEQQTPKHYKQYNTKMNA
jgi:hypothetical protein